MVIRFFDKETLKLKGEFARFSKTTQTKYINAVGSFSITTDYIPEDLEVEDIILVSGKDCEPYCGEVLQVAGDLTTDGESYTFSGREILGLLTERIPVYNGGPLKYSALSREAIIKDLITKTFVSPDIPARAISQIAVALSKDRGTSISYSAKADTSVLDNAFSVAKDANFGMALIPDFNQGKYVFDLIVPKTPAIILSPKFDNLANEHFMYSRSTHKNIAYYGFTANEVTTYGSVELNAGSGFARKERWINASGTSETEAQSFINMQLGNFKPIENYTGDYKQSRTFIYGTDFTLGDFITYSGKAGTVVKQVVGFTQTHEAGQYTQQLLFGDNLAEIVRNIQKIEGSK